MLRARVPVDRALLALAGELRDESADKVIGPLIHNARQRGAGLAAVLTGLATSARAELDQRRRISAGRASMRRSVQIVVVITIAFAIFLVIFSRAYVAPYGSAAGQVVLAAVVALFAAAFAWMRKLAGGEPTTPFLAVGDSRLAEADRRVVAHLTAVGVGEFDEPSRGPASAVSAGERR
jgi:Flp pilus assembly protein TadB